MYVLVKLDDGTTSLSCYMIALCMVVIIIHVLDKILTIAGLEACYYQSAAAVTAKFIYDSL